MSEIVKGEKHSTASVWIVTNSVPKKVLLVHHKKYNKWIQPGGHIEKFENPVECAIREVKEETGLDIGYLIDKLQISKDGDIFLPVPDFFMEQSIPAYHDQPQHFHLDINYVVEVDEQGLTHNVSESHGIGWFTKDEALNLPIHENTKIILQKLL